MSGRRPMMPLHFNKSGYTFSVDAGSLTIEPGSKPIHLTRSDLERLGLAVRDDYQVPPTRSGEGESLVGGILGALSHALKILEGSGHGGDRRNIRRAMALVGGLDRRTAQIILDKDGA
jgi:hypothetical protein